MTCERNKVYEMGDAIKDKLEQYLKCEMQDEEWIKNWIGNSIILFFMRGIMFEVRC